MLDDDPGLSEDEPSGGGEPKLPPYWRKYSQAERDRHDHQCRHDGCDSAAVWAVYLHFRYGVRLVAIETLSTTLRVCDKHRMAASKFLLSEHNKKNISTEMAKIGRLNIDWPRAMVEYVPVGERPWGPHNMTALKT